MIKSIRVVNPSKEMLDLDLETSHIETGIYIKSITGIGPEKASINTTALAMEDGGVFNSARADVRNIVLTLGFYESPTLHNSIEDSRHLTYQFFPKKKQITLEFYTDNRDSFIQGYVESNEPDIFSKEESTQISIICPDPNFYSLDMHASHMGGIDGAFEFPFENDTVEKETSFVGGMNPDLVTFSTFDPPVDSPSQAGMTCYCRTDEFNVFNEYIADGLTWYRTNYHKYVPEAEIIMSIINKSSIHQIIYDGDVDTGMIMTIHFIGPASNISIENYDTKDILKLDTEKIKTIVGSEIISGDDIILTTYAGQKSIVYRRAGTNYNILNAIDREYFETCWFRLQKGINQYLFIADTGYDNIKITIDAYIAYDGV